MAHPELISMVTSVLGAPAASADHGTDSDTASEDTPIKADAESGTAEPSDAVSVSASAEKFSSADLMTALTPLLSGLGVTGKGGKKKDSDDPRACLLRALKPYVNQGRREAIDYMIRLSQISDLLKHLS